MVFMLDPKKFSDFPPEASVDGSEIIPIVKDGENSSVTIETLRDSVPVITDHGQLGGLSDDDHAQYALADGSRGNFATPGQGALADTALQNISGQDLSTADNTTSAFITAADVPAETDPVFAASSAASITPTDITHLADLDSAAYEPSTAFAPALGADDNYVTDAEKSNLHTHSNKTILDNTTASFTTADETKLYGIAAGAQVNTVTSVAAKTGAVTLDKADVGLGNVDNTSDANKPISSATQTALNAKQDTLVSGTNIKTINGTDLLGSGNITISGGGGGGSDELRGTGMPNGVVTANPGTYYTDTNGTNGAWRWLKTSGTSNTGWVVTVGDTGWRNVNSLLNAYFTIGTGGYVYYRRIGANIYVKVYDIAVNEASRVAELPSVSGFKDFTPTEYGIINYPIGQTFRVISLSGLSITFVRPPKDLLLRHSEIFTTTDAWPTTLPGTAA